ncbi:protein BUD31 [Vespula maculifrons]
MRFILLTKSYKLSYKFLSISIVIRNCSHSRITFAENSYCSQYVQINDTNFGTNCVSKGKLEESKIVKCMNCGCRGCSG